MGGANDPHALLMEGMRGIGKSAFAREFAEALLCEQPTDSHEACDRASPVVGWRRETILTSGSFNRKPWLVTRPIGANDSAASKKKPSQQITIDQIRDLDEFLHVGTHRHGLRVITVNPAEAMNRATANALLKALEEPIASTLFILVTSDPGRLLPTIRSRCQSVVIPLPAKDLCATWLAGAG